MTIKNDENDGTLEKILVVEDREDYLENAEQAMQDLGVDAVYATDLAEAKTHLATNQITGVLTDMSYPIKTGTDDRIGPVALLAQAQAIAKGDETAYPELIKLQPEDIVMLAERTDAVVPNLDKLVFSLEEQEVKLGGWNGKSLALSQLEKGKNNRNSKYFAVSMLRDLVNRHNRRRDKEVSLEIPDEVLYLLERIEDGYQEVRHERGLDESKIMDIMDCTVPRYELANLVGHYKSPIGGLELFHVVQQKELPVVIVSGYSPGHGGHDEITEEITMPLRKVFPDKVNVVYDGKGVGDWKEAYDMLQKQKIQGGK